MKKSNEKEVYMKEIVEMMEKIENIWILNQILQFIQNMTKED